MTSQQAPEWTKWALGWHVYPLGFVGAPIADKQPAPADQPGPITRLIPWLDYLQKMGLNVLQLAPIFESTTHGYDTEDYFRIDSRLGDEGDVVKLIEQAHERGIKVLFDGVFNHIGAKAPEYLQAWENPDSPAAEKFALERTDEGVRAQVFEGHEGLVEFDHTKQATVDFVVDIMNYWLDHGVDGWRLDAAYSVDSAFWAKVLPRVRESHPNAYIYGEVIHGDYQNIVASSGMDSVTEYELWKAIWSSLKEENFFELEWTLRRHNGFLESFVPVTFVGNHDVTRIATQVGAEKAALAATVLFTVGGVPLVYYGDEQGYTGVKEERFGGDDQIRPSFPESADEFSALGAGVFETYQQLIALRRRYPWLNSAQVDIEDVQNKTLQYRVSATDEDLVSGPRELRVQLSVENGVSAIVRDGNQVVFQVG